MPLDGPDTVLRLLSLVTEQRPALITTDDALAVLASLGAPPRLVVHGRLVA
jgi:hypothetical protein